jgi:UDP-N-acetylmuramoylalanine--D-glutamate ligase
VRFSELDGAAVGVWGAGREIGSLARQLERRLPRARIAVIGVDAEPDDGVRALAAATGARIVSGAAEAAAALAACDAVVRSPGVSIHRPELVALREGGTPVTTATALWLAERGGRGVIGITGTKGKSTTAALTAHLARAAGVATDLAGNIGVPALDLLDAPPSELAVIELSSYQIADLAMGTEVAVLTNLYREHLDWHGSEEAYRRDKLRLLELPGVRVAVVGPGAGAKAGNADSAAANGDERAAATARAAGAELTRFGTADGWSVAADGALAYAGETLVAAEALPLRGAHNALNLCAALTALTAAGIALPPLPAAFEGFRALPHRLEPIGERDDVLWVDDSISTTPESAVAALDSYAGLDVVLLAGGQDRGQDYAALGAALAARGAAVIGLPSTGPRVVAAARAAGVPEDRALAAADLDEAVALARGLAASGAVVLLSPAAPSYDRFRDFIERGERFRAAAALG